MCEVKRTEGNYFYFLKTLTIKFRDKQKKNKRTGREIKNKRILKLSQINLILLSTILKCKKKKL